MDGVSSVAFEYSGQKRARGATTIRSFDKSILLFEIQSGTILGNVQSLWKITFPLCESSE